MSKRQPEPPPDAALLATLHEQRVAQDAAERALRAAREWAAAANEAHRAVGDFSEAFKTLFGTANKGDQRR